jgi:hypothetical protein
LQTFLKPHRQFLGRLNPVGGQIVIRPLHKQLDYAAPNKDAHAPASIANLFRRRNSYQQNVVARNLKRHIVRQRNFLARP